MTIKNLIEAIKSGEGYNEVFSEVWVSIMEEKIDSLRAEVILDTFFKIDEGIVVGVASKAFHKKVSPAKYDLHITDVTGKSHRVYSVADKDGDEKKAKKAAMTMTKELAKRYGVKSFHQEENDEKN